MEDPFNFPKLPNSLIVHKIAHVAIKYITSQQFTYNFVHIHITANYNQDKIVLNLVRDRLEEIVRTSRNLHRTDLKKLKSIREKLHLEFHGKTS